MGKDRLLEGVKIHNNIKPGQIISGIKNMLLSCDAITISNGSAIEEVLNTTVLQSIIEYGKQDNKNSS